MTNPDISDLSPRAGCVLVPGFAPDGFLAEGYPLVVCDFYGYAKDPRRKSTIDQGFLGGNPQGLKPLSFALLGVRPGSGGYSFLEIPLSKDHGHVLLEMLKVFKQKQVKLIVHDVKQWLFSLWSALGDCHENPPTGIYDIWLAGSCLREIPEEPSIRRNETVRSYLGRRADFRRQHGISADGDPYTLEGLTKRLPPRPAFNPPIDIRVFAKLNANQNLKRQITAGMDLSSCQLMDKLLAIYRVYLDQVPKLIESDLVGHLANEEVPYAVANARVEFSGVRLSAERKSSAKEAIQQALGEYQQAISKVFGIPSNNITDARLWSWVIHNYPELVKAHTHLPKNFFKDHREDIPKFGLICEYQRVKGQSNSVDPRFCSPSASGHRTHSQLIQNGTVTGRTKTINPPLANLTKILRPLVIPAVGYGLFELDFGQIEAALMGGLFGDKRILAAYADGCIYLDAAKSLYVRDLKKESHELDRKAFEAVHPGLRDKVKQLFIAVIYGISDRRLAKNLHLRSSEAHRLRIRLLDLYPQVRDGLSNLEEEGRRQGYAQVPFRGLRRKFDPTLLNTSRVRRQLRNTPIQGLAATVFKRGVVLLDQFLTKVGGKIILLNNDSCLVEAPLVGISEVASQAAKVFSDSANPFFPGLRLQVSIAHQEDYGCWSDGKPIAVRRFNQHLDQLRRISADQLVAKFTPS